MGLLRFLAEAFIGFFGITEPSPGQRRMVSIVLGGFLLGVFVIVLSVTGFLVYQLHGGR
jgi:hypothetical protein